MATLNQRYDAVFAMLEPIGQAHALAFYKELDDIQREQLLAQIEGIDWPEVARLIETHVQAKPAFELRGEVKPAPWYPYTPPDALKRKYKQARELGEDLIAAGKVAAFTVAGGQGTRLGWDAPKGTFPATPIRKLPLFGCFAEYIIAAQNRYNVVIPWYIMTSPINDAATRAFFNEHQCFGLDPHNVRIFPQAMMPALDRHTGKVLLADKDALALSPNGHGGSLKALYRSGAIDDMAGRGVEQISYVQVDNPLVRVIDPIFIGLHALDKAQMSSKMLPKRDPFEKLGNLCLIDGKMTVIEYSNLPDDLAVQRVDTGELRFRAGSIAIHVIRADFVRKLNESEQGFALPFNRAEKKVPCIDTATGQPVDISGGGGGNAVKLETFVFDALPMTDSSIVYESDRDDEFAPIKNAPAPGTLDSPATSIEIQMARHRKWLREAGVDVADDATVEIKFTTALYPEDLQHASLPKSIGPGECVLL